ncbi:MAG: metal-dependent hydrolase [Bacteroidetes bacterium]|nr:metal-dependent hydrolase [Bacteroidota bacterium]MCW5896693.1 metal-dependent hydrolase [Bacteroidota bacterium]
MIAPTHITFAEFLYLLILTTTGVALSPINAIVVGIASLLPDVDTQASTVGKLIPFISKRIERRFGHRTLTHSVMFIVSLAIVFSPLLILNLDLNLDLYLCFLIGYASHPFLDTMTVNGVKLFYPFSNVKCVFPFEVNQPHRYRVQTGSKVDKTLAFFFLIGCIPTFLIAHQGYERFVRFTQRSIGSAVRDYNELSKTHAVVADITAHDLLTKQKLTGRFEIVGALNDHTLLFKTNDNKLHTVGKEYQAEYVAENILCYKGSPVTTAIRSVDMANHTLGLLANYFNPDDEVLFFGTLRTRDKVALPPDPDGGDREFSPVKGSSSHLAFNYASMNDITRLGLENVLIEQGTLIARSVVRVTNADVMWLHLHSPYAEVSFVATPDQNITLQARVGDTVDVNDVIATLALTTPIEAQIQLHRNQINALKAELSHKLDELQAKIEKKRSEFRRDSMGTLRQRELQKRGFSAQGGNMQSHRSSTDLRVLVNSQTILREKYDLKIQKHNTDILRLQAKQKTSLQGDALLRSTASGIITEIRQTSEGTKRRTTFIIRRLGKVQ